MRIARLYILCAWCVWLSCVLAPPWSSSARAAVQEQRVSAPPANASGSDNPSTPSAPSPPATPASPSTTDSADSARDANRRLTDLAKRLADTTSAASPPRTAANAPVEAPAPPASPKPPPSRTSATGSAKIAPTSDEAAPQRQYKLADPDDRLPLGPRKGASDAPQPDDANTNPTGGSWALNTLSALGVVVLLILLFRSGLRRWFGAATAAKHGGVVEVLTRISVAPRNHVLLLRIGGRVLVVGDSSAGLRTLADITDAEEVADLLAAVDTARSSSVSNGFRQLLGGFNRQYRDDEQRVDQGADTSEAHVDRARDRVGGLLARLRSMTGLGGGP